MRLTDFLICLLQFHSRVLRSLQDLLGEEALLAVLERSAEEGPSISYSTLKRLAPSDGARKIQALRSSPVSPYEELESAVSSSDLHHALQFHLWAYPSYRALIESSLGLDEALPGSAEPWVQESLAHSETWYATLPLPGEIRVQADPPIEAARTWLQMEVRKRCGEKGLKSLS